MPNRNITSEQRRRKDMLKLKELRAQIKLGLDELDSGRFTEIADADLDTYLEGLANKAAKRTR